MYPERCDSVRAQESNCVDAICVRMPNNVNGAGVSEFGRRVRQFHFHVSFIVSTVYVFCIFSLILSLSGFSLFACLFVWLWITIGFFGSLTPLFNWNNEEKKQQKITKFATVESNLFELIWWMHTIRVVCSFQQRYAIVLNRLIGVTCTGSQVHTTFYRVYWMRLPTHTFNAL